MRPVHRPLPGGFVLRSAVAADHDAILALEVEAFGASDAPIVRSRLADLDGWLVVEDPEAPDHVAGRIASASVLLAHRLQLGDVVLPVGQIENVATHSRYRRRGLVRAQFEEHHARSDGRGDRAGLITGIPYLYRRLGYGYGLDYPTIHLPTAETLGRVDGADEVDAAIEVSAGGPGDLDGILGLDATRSTDELRIRRDRASWQRTLARSADTRFEQLVVARRHGAVVGFAQLEARPWAERLYVQPAMAADPAVVRALLAHTVDQAAALGEMVVAFDNPATTYGAALARVGPPVHHSHGIYVRVPDPLALLDDLRPVLSRRLAASRYADRLGLLSISTYTSGISLFYDRGVVTDLAPADAVEDPFDSGGVGVPPDQIGALAFGRFGAVELERRVDDVTLGSHRGLVEVLFPKVPAEVIADL